MDFTSVPKPVRFVLGFVIVAFPISMWLFALGSVQLNPAHVREFTLCQEKDTTSNPIPLSSLVLTPTSEIYACGYLEVKHSQPWNMCLNFYLNREGDTVFRPELYCLPVQSDYFLYPIKTRELRVPGLYRLYVYDVGTANWLESVAFEINSSSK
jgi:hypothetical protein